MNHIVEFGVVSWRRWWCGVDDGDLVVVSNTPEASEANEIR